MPEEALHQSADAKTTRFRRLAAILAGDALGTGGKASLRRNDPAAVLAQPAFHRATNMAGIAIHEQDAEAWATIVQATALTAGHPAALPTGKALAQAGLSEARFTRLMAARGDMLRDQFSLAARYLSSKQVPVDWTDLGNLLLADSRDDDETLAKLRFRLAQAYYRELNRADQQGAG